MKTPVLGLPFTTRAGLQQTVPNKNPARSQTVRLELKIQNSSPAALSIFALLNLSSPGKNLDRKTLDCSLFLSLSLTHTHIQAPQILL